MESSKFRIAKLEIRHLSQVVSVAEESFSKAWLPGEFAYFLEHDARLCNGAFAADDPRDLLGFGLGLLIRGDLDIISIAVRPRMRRQGLGFWILGKMMQDPRVERTFLEVDVENTAAIRLYEKLGFRTISTRRGYYDNVRDAYLMRHGVDKPGP